MNELKREGLSGPSLFKFLTLYYIFLLGDYMKKLFVSLPMAGVSDEYIKKRMDEILAYINETLTDGPYELLDTFVEKSDDIPDQAGTYCLGRSISLLTDADLVVFDVNWRRARGCLIENMVCNLYHIYWMELTRSGEFPW